MGADFFGILSQIFTSCSQVMSHDFYVAGISFNLWDVAIVVGVIAGANALVQVGMDDYD